MVSQFHHQILQLLTDSNIQWQQRQKRSHPYRYLIQTDPLAALARSENLANKKTPRGVNALTHVRGLSQEISPNTNEIDMGTTNTPIQLPSSLPQSKGELEANHINKIWEERQKQHANKTSEELAQQKAESSKEMKLKGKGKKGKQKTAKLSTLEEVEESIEDGELLKNYLLK